MITQKLKEILESLEASISDAEKCESGNISAGRRTRKICMETIKELKELRQLILESSKK